eukprot:716200-Pleurochrysis_carterae.AAC.2
MRRLRIILRAEGKGNAGNAHAGAAANQLPAAAAVRIIGLGDLLREYQAAAPAKCDEEAAHALEASNQVGLGVHSERHAVGDAARST